MVGGGDGASASGAGGSGRGVRREETMRTYCVLFVSCVWRESGEEEAGERIGAGA